MEKTDGRKAVLVNEQITATRTPKMKPKSSKTTKNNQCRDNSIYRAIYIVPVQTFKPYGANKSKHQRNEISEEAMCLPWLQLLSQNGGTNLDPDQ